MEYIRLSIAGLPPALPCAYSELPGFERWENQSGGEHGFGFFHGSQFWMRIHRVGDFLVAPGYERVSAYPEPGVSGEWLREMFFRLIVPWIIQRREWDCLHGSAVLTDCGVIGFCGPSGRGKSTLARAFCEHGAVAYADDAVPFRMRHGRAWASSIPQRLRPRQPAAAAYPESITPGGAAMDRSELTYALRETAEPLRAVFWLEPMRAASPLAAPDISALAAPEAFRRLLTEAHCMTLRDRAANRKMIENYFELVAATPIYQLAFPADLSRIGRTIEAVGALLAEGGPSGAIPVNLTLAGAARDRCAV
jgi:hypothetical protein